MPINHEDFYRGIDRLAAERGISVSALAVRAGLDATTFNRSKRDRDGAPRWISAESIAKTLNATGCTLAHYAALATNNPEN